MRQGGQTDFGRERQRSNHRPGSEGSIIWPIRDTTSHVTKKASLDAIDSVNGVARTVTSGDSPAILVVAFETQRVMDRILLLDVGRTSAVLKVVDAFLAHEFILNTTKINPEMRQLVDEEWTTVQKFIVVQFLPAIGASPGPITSGGQRVRWRPQRQRIQQ